MTVKIWSSIDGSTLKSLPNAAKGYEQRIAIPEFTFLGVKNQPDFGNITIWFYGKDRTIELKSLKEYLFQYRDTVISYERALDVMYKDLMKAYEPDRIRIEIEFRRCASRLSHNSCGPRSRLSFVCLRKTS